LPSLSLRLVDEIDYHRFRWRAGSLLVRDPDRLGSTGEEIADLCLRRLLTLQREARRVSLVRQREALAALTRMAVEIGIVGMYSVWTDDREWSRRVTRSGVHHFHRTMVGFLGSDLAFPDGLMEVLEDSGPRMQQVAQLADGVDGLVSFGGDRVGRKLYDEVYVPLSNMVVHAGFGSLQRYRNAGRRHRRRPFGVVGRRASVRTVDAVAGFVAASIAARRGVQPGWFVHYGHVRYRAANRPVPVWMLTTASDEAWWALRRRLRR
jgi:hypothetical protein